MKRTKPTFAISKPLLLESSLATGEDAQALLKEVQASPVKGYQLQAGVQLGQLLLTGDDAAGALAAFQQVIDQSAGDPSSSTAQFDGLLGKAECQQKQGQTDEAIATLDGSDQSGVRIGISDTGSGMGPERRLFPREESAKRCSDGLSAC